MKKIKLFLAALAAMVSVGASAQLTSGTVYWLQDTGTGQFLSQGDAWSTKAVMKDVGGLGFEAVLVSGNVYQLKNVMWNTVKNVNVGLGAAQYVDQVLADYTITAVTGGYTVSLNGNYLVNNGSENAYKEKPIGTTTDASAATVWNFLTKTQYDAALQAYYDGRAAAMATSMGLTGISSVSALESEIAGVDYVSVDQTSKITNPTIGTNDEGWSHGMLGNRGKGNSSQTEGWGVGSGCAEYWDGCGYAKQTVSGLPNGLYRITFVGTYRPANSAEANNLVSEKTSSPAFVYANNDKKEFLHWIDVPAKANGRSGITTANGYGHTFYTYVTNGTIELGVVADGWAGQYIWNPFGQFTLTQIYSLAMYQAMLDDAVANAATYEGIIPTAAYAAIDDVVDEQNTTWSTADEYTAAIDAINTAVSTYATSDIQAAYTLVLETKALVAQTDYTVGTTELAAFQGYIDAADAATTLSALNTAVADIKSHVLDFATAVTFDTNAYFDLTNFLVVNPTVSENTTGWTAEGTPNTSYSWAVVNYGETEFYQQNFKFYQTLTLPRGTWEFGVTGFHRAGDHTTYFYAGDDRILIPGVGADIVNTMSMAKDYFDAGNGRVALKFALEDASTNLEIGIENTDTQTDKWTIFRNFTLKFYGSAIDYSAYATRWSEAVTAANSAKTTYSTVTVGSEYAALNAAIANVPTGTSKADYIAKTDALTTATATFTAAAPYYEALAREIAKAKALGIADADADKYAAAASTTAATALTATQNLMVDEYDYVNTNFNNAVDLGTWNQSSNAGVMSSQHWSDDGSRQYLEQSGGAYTLPSWTVTYDQTLSLPAGNYIFKVAGRTAADHVTLTLNVTDVTDPEAPELLGSVNDFPKGDTGLGINTSGATDFTTGEGHTYANSGAGRGWQWRYVRFTLEEPAQVEVAVEATADAQYRWMSFCDATVQTDDADNVAIMEALVALNDAKTVASLTQRTNTGTGVFQYDATADASLWAAYTTAKSNAESFSLAADTEVDDVTTLTSALTAAIAAYNNNAAINAPSTSAYYKLTLANKGALTFSKNDGAQSGYGMPFQTAADYKAQAFQFESTGDANTYYIYFTDNEGQKRYICNGVPWGASTGADGIRTLLATDVDGEKTPLGILVSPDATTPGLFYLLNTSAANKKLGAENNGDLYTSSANSNWSIAEAVQASVTVAAKAGKYGTVIFPFTPDVSSGFGNITFYSTDAVNGITNTVTMEPVAEPAANTPYIIKNADSDNDFSKTLTGWGTASADTYTAGLLTGVYTAATIAADANNYVLQTQSGTQAFYSVDAAFTATAYKAYLTYDAGGAVKSLSFGFGTPTGVNAIETVAAEAPVYNLAGQRVDRARKGLYIVGGKKVVR